MTAIQMRTRVRRTVTRGRSLARRRPLCKVLKNAHMFLAPPAGLKVLGSKPEWSSGHMT
jgi:hypothetical protein